MLVGLVIVLTVVGFAYFSWSQYSNFWAITVGTGRTQALCDVFATNCSGNQVRIGGYLILNQGVWALSAPTGQSCNTGSCKAQDLFRLTLSSSMMNELATLSNSQGSWVNVSGVITQPSILVGYDGDIAVSYIAFSTMTLTAD